MVDHADDRKDFEAALLATLENGVTVSLKRDRAGDYVARYARSCYALWQAARRLSQPAPTSAPDGSLSPTQAAIVFSALLAMEEVVACDPTFDEHYPKTRALVESAIQLARDRNVAEHAAAATPPPPSGSRGTK